MEVVTRLLAGLKSFLTPLCLKLGDMFLLPPPPPSVGTPCPWLCLCQGGEVVLGLAFCHWPPCGRDSLPAAALDEWLRRVEDSYISCCAFSGITEVVVKPEVIY